MRFNSRTREGCDYFTSWGLLLESTFQFTHPGGVRPHQILLRLAVEAFQFTHPGGVRLSLIITQLRDRCVSIHAPGRGATTLPLGACSWSLRFNSRTREGCDRIKFFFALLSKRFNSRTREGCD